MEKFNGRTAVVTGAAKGIGLALARQCVAEGMRVVLADIDATALADAAAQLRRARGDVLAVRTDVADEESVQDLARASVERYGEVALLFNNAGVAAAGDLGQLWQAAREDWRRLIDVNLWGVIHGCTSFLPVMLAQAAPSRIVNIASIAGILAPPPLAIYAMTKHAVVGLSEALAGQLAAASAPVGVSVVCPGFVRTGLAADLAPRAGETPAMADNRAWFEDRVAAGTAAADLARKVFEGIRQDRLFIFTHGEFRAAVAQRFQAILDAFDGV